MARHDLNPATDGSGGHGDLELKIQVVGVFVFNLRELGLSWEIGNAGGGAQKFFKLCLWTFEVSRRMARCLMKE